MKNMENENKFNSIDDIGGAAFEGSEAIIETEVMAKDQMHMPCSGINFFGCGAGGEF